LRYCNWSSVAGAVYQYFNVPSAVHQSLWAAPSKGRYFNQAIRGRFPFRLIPVFQAGPRDAEMPAECDR
jgi:KTSC domain